MPRTSTVDLRLGDCLELMRDIPAGSVDAIITDPPYFLPAMHYQTRKQFRRNFSDLGILESFFRNWFEQAARVIKPHGVMYIFCDGQSYPMFYYHAYLISKSLRPLIWDKMVAFNGYSWRHQHELVLFAEMPEAKPVPTGDGDILRFRAVPVNDRQHPAEKPVELLEKLMAKTPENAVVLDPFMGSGSTGVACVRLNRNFIGMEIDPTYFAIAQKRIAGAQAQMVTDMTQEESNATH